MKKKILFNYCNFLYFELEGKKMSKLSKIKKGDELHLKLSEEILKKLIHFLKMGIFLYAIEIKYCSNLKRVKKEFLMEK